MHLQTTKEGGDSSGTVRSTNKRNPRCPNQRGGNERDDFSSKRVVQARKLQTTMRLRTVKRVY
jgi:hypothetical protein